MIRGDEKRIAKALILGLRWQRTMSSRTLLAFLLSQAAMENVANV